MTFDNAAAVDESGRKLLENGLRQGVSRFELNLAGLIQADSSTLSVCLSWLRLAQKHNVSLCFSDIPPGLQALAVVCGIDTLLDESSCSIN